MRLFTDRVYQIPVKDSDQHATLLRLLHPNLFEKRDLMALLRDDSPINRCKLITSQLCFERKVNGTAVI